MKFPHAVINKVIYDMKSVLAAVVGQHCFLGLDAFAFVCIGVIYGKPAINAGIDCCLHNAPFPDSILPRMPGPPVRNSNLSVCPTYHTRGPKAIEISG
jgi:hypothetical protein